MTVTLLGPVGSGRRHGPVGSTPSAGARPRCVVELEVALGQAVHREARRPGARPTRPARPAQRLVVEHPAQRRRPARRRRRAATSSASAPGAGDVAVAGQVAGHDRRARPPSPRAARRRRTRRRSDGAQNTSAPRSRARLLVVADPARATRCGGRRACRPAAPSVSGPSPPTQSRTSAGQPAHGVEQHGQALAGLVAADEEDRRARRSATASALANRSTSTPLNSSVVLAAERAARPAGRASSDTAQRRSSRSRQPAHAPGRASGRRRSSPGGVERADERRGLRTAARSCVGPGRERLVQVDDVERLVAERPDRAQLGRRVGRERGDRAVGRGRDAACRAA